MVVLSEDHFYQGDRKGGLDVKEVFTEFFIKNRTDLISFGGLFSFKRGSK